MTKSTDVLGAWISEIISDPSMDKYLSSLKGGMLPEINREYTEPTYGYIRKEGKDVVQVEVPGLSKEDIEIKVRNGALIVSFSRSSLWDTARVQKYKLELSFAPTYILKAEHIDAEVKNGLLIVEIDLAKCDQSFMVSIRS
jgi:HSP20 family molecular chaperone IbpA